MKFLCTENYCFCCLICACFCFLISSYFFCVFCVAKSFLKKIWVCLDSLVYYSTDFTPINSLFKNLFSTKFSINFFTAFTSFHLHSLWFLSVRVSSYLWESLLIHDHLWESFLIHDHLWESFRTSHFLQTWK